MDRRHTDGFERSLESNVEMMLEAGFDRVSGDFSDRETARRISNLVKPQGKKIEGVVYPKTVDEMKPVLEWATEFGVHHINLQPNVRPRRLQDCMPYLEGWQRLAENVTFPVYFETHRDRMTTDLYFTLHLLDCFPDLRLTGDLSHYVVGREFAWPISEENHALMRRILDNCWGFHGRVASREQVQLQITFAHHKQWVDLFMGWWAYGLKRWSSKAGPDATFTFLCEMGPREYAMTGPDGYELSDRWQEAILMKDMVREMWRRVGAD